MTTADVAAISQEVTVVNLARAAKEASRKASSLSTAAKDSALERMSGEEKRSSPAANWRTHSFSA
jgi:hypothetical protein